MPLNNSQYNTVSHADNYDDSSTEVGESLMGDEKQWHSIDLDAGPTVKGDTWKRFKTTLRRYRWLIDTLLLLTNIGLSLGLSLLLYYQFEDAKYPSSTRQVGGDFTAAGPQCESDFGHGRSLNHRHGTNKRTAVPTKTVKFEADHAIVPPNATDFLSNATLSQWKSIMPGNDISNHAGSRYPSLTPSQSAQGGSQ